MHAKNPHDWGPGRVPPLVVKSARLRMCCRGFDSILVPGSRSVQTLFVRAARGINPNY